VHQFLASLASIPETTGLLLIGIVLILFGIVLRKIFLNIGGAVTGANSGVKPEDQFVK
jgi:hypothetical protein